MVFSQLELPNLYYLEFFSYILTFLQNYSLCESLIQPDEVTKSGKSTITTSKLLFARVFSLKQKTNQIRPAPLEKVKYCVFKKTVHGSFEKTNHSDIFIHILAYFDIFTYKQTYSQAYSEPSVIPVY